MLNRQLILSISFIAIGLLMLFRSSNLIAMENWQIAGYICWFYGITSLFTSIGKNKKGVIFFSSTIFLIGVLIYVTNNYEFITLQKLFLSSLLFILGGGFLMLFIDDLTQKIFLIISTIQFAFSVLSIQLYDSISLIRLANRISIVVSQYWPVLLILAGLGIMLNKNR